MVSKTFDYSTSSENVFKFTFKTDENNNILPATFGVTNPYNVKWTLKQIPNETLVFFIKSGNTLHLPKDIFEVIVSEFSKRFKKAFENITTPPRKGTKLRIFSAIVEELVSANDKKQIAHFKEFQVERLPFPNAWIFRRMKDDVISSTEFLVTLREIVDIVYNEKISTDLG